MVLEVLKYPHPKLAQKAEPIGEITPEIRKLADDMAVTMYENQGIGLAANQVGQCVRLVVIDITGPDKREDLKVLVNPRILAREGEIESEEGCLSVRDYRSTVLRSEKVTVEALNLDGETVRYDADELFAICLQHEIDHLDGTLFIDHISRLKRSLYDKRVRKWDKRKEGRETPETHETRGTREARETGAARTVKVV